ncbi:sensor histidine kinase [Tepidibacter formicigenes]|jgi:signal transduction histidine kinase|uniref:histidine kinase n=1 Tax=Tepidibacter formicigenes DSM 15518 TaxID=1123349 RepID=A0A1M6S9C1_9FIRM|nr:ATP-binding protein [Tepidibacter formicigenes]SHK41363.1 HAMP domain-containing protein [Tepidibacter formicigenes DSM 15518]
MKKSIRLRLFRGISFIVIFFVVFSWFLNSQFLEKYYISKKKNMLIENSKIIDSLYKGNSEDIALELEILERTIGANVTILNERGIKYKTNYKRFDLKRIKQEIRIFNNKVLSNLRKRNIVDGRFVFVTQKDQRLKIDFLALQTILNNGDILILRIPLAAISESVATANDFMLFTGILSILLGSIWALIFSKRFTKPILELKNIAQAMANLDFTKKCSITEDDEIGELGNIINHLSNQLDSAISELNEKNQKLIQDIEKERKLEEMRKEFVSSVSHELKTPIALIQGYAEGLIENVMEDEESKNFYCEVIMDEAKKMDKLVRDLLNLSQIESGYFQLERTDFDISSVINQVISKYKNILEEKGIDLRFRSKENIVVNGDIIRIEQILVNFINNAINHVDNKKIIGISIESEEQKVRVYVFNSGKHIPEESLDKIWTSFYKVDKARTRDYGGSGLGLSIVRGIQELHNNDFGVDNVDGGVRFWFEMDRLDANFKIYK